MKINSKLPAFVFAFLQVIALKAQQTSSTRNFMQNRYLLERMSSTEQLAMGTVQTLPMAPPEVLGTDLLNRNYNRATFLLNDSSLLEGLPARYYIMRNEFDVKTGQGVRTLKGDRVKSFVWLDSATSKPQVFVNMKEYKRDDGTPGAGFMQILCEGKIGLLKQTEVIFKEANYHVALNVGSRDHQFITKTHLYYLIGSTFRLLPPKKKMLFLFNDHQAEIQRFVKINELDLTNEYHVQALFDYYNSLQ
ncbi:MAG: hypothetical protein N2044_03420 [Cyclobacteriaceae bacterium]|nr:hypothetical protein [Cyclobacteriaceae bacterium]MCX7636876.1 hypothetical protein [Cyclobacteriaceae bacterium]MDW8330238.1 hypothetical protein [Cyclobacteriaceae bacterium]